MWGMRRRMCGGVAYGLRQLARKFVRPGFDKKIKTPQEGMSCCTSGHFQCPQLQPVVILQILMERTKFFPDCHYLPYIKIPECCIPLNGGGEIFKFCTKINK